MTFTRDALIGFAALIIIVIGLCWYAFSHPPAPMPENPGQATSTPIGNATGPAHITESAEFYTVDTQYPSETVLAGLPDSADVNAVALMKQWEMDSITEYKKSWTNLGADFEQHLRDEHLKGSFTITYETHQSPHTVTYVYTIFSDTLGAHPNTTYKTFTFDTTNGQNLSLAMLFNPGTNYLKWFSDYSRAQLPAMIAAREQVDVSQVDQSMLNAGTTADAANFADFYLDGSNVVILFPPYAIGPYVLGSTQLVIPASQIPGLKSQYP
ncbi:MAG TPA: RsiV family protein [Candidatus Paceibacterota bacterium]|nr:RsiV family protein [Candidatus Paceibacterota bacterium]